jgi:hypothetical protein
MTSVAFILGALTGSVVTWVFVALLVHRSASSKKQETNDINARSLEALLERNRISARQLELMEARAAK